MTLLHLVRIITSILCITLTSCAQLYKITQPHTQKDHPLSELGLRKVNAGPNDRGRVEGSEFSLQTPNPLEKGRPTYLVLQIDGGGIMGITPAKLIATIEGELQKRRGFSQGKLRDVTSVCSGTSTGAIIAGAITAGVPGEKISQFYYEDGYQLFRKEGRQPLYPALHYKFDRRAFQAKMLATLEAYSDYPPTVRMQELQNGPLVILAAYDLVQKQTIFLRNRGQLGAPIPSGQNLQLIDAISASALNAPVMFGKLGAPDVVTPHVNADGTGYHIKGAIFADGGQGTQNSTIGLAAIEGLEILRAHPGAQVVVISLGSGNNFEERDFNKTMQLWGFQQLTDYLLRNQARNEAVQLQWMAVRHMAAIVDGLEVFRFDWNHTESKDASSFSVTAKQRDWLSAKADEIAERSDFRQLMKDLSDDRVILKQHRS